MLYCEIKIETNSELTEKIIKKCSAESVKEDKQKAILVKLNAVAKRIFGENENKAMYFSDCGEKEITAVAGYKYDCFSEIYDDTAFVLRNFPNEKSI